MLKKHDLFKVTAQLKPGFGRHTWSPADHENRSDTLLKLLDPLTDRGLSDVERLRGAIEASLATGFVTPVQDPGTRGALRVLEGGDRGTSRRRGHLHLIDG